MPRKKRRRSHSKSRTQTDPRIEAPEEIDEGGKRVGKAIRDVVDTQLRENNPPETRETYERLRAEGYSDEEARELIGAIVTIEIYEVMKYQRPFDREKFVSRLRDLPQLPPD